MNLQRFTGKSKATKSMQDCNAKHKDNVINNYSAMQTKE